MTLPGVDIASYQGEPGQWRAAAGDITWAAVKFTEVSEQGLYEDPFAAGDWQWLRDNGKGRIAYLFAHPATSPTQTVASFAAMCGTLGLDDGDGIALDFETSDGLTAARVAQWGADVLAIMQRELRRVPLIYTYPAFAWEGNCTGLEHWPLWISSPGSPPGHPDVPAPWRTFAMHQWFTPADGAGGIDKDVAMWPSLAGMRTAIGKTGGTVTETDWTADGKTSLAQAARDHKTAPSSILRRTAVHDGEFAADVAGWLDDVFGGKVSAEAPVPHGLVLRVPA